MLLTFLRALALFSVTVFWAVTKKHFFIGVQKKEGKKAQAGIMGIPTGKTLGQVFHPCYVCILVFPFDF